MKQLTKFLAATVLISSVGISSQTMSSDHWSRDKLLERAQRLRESAAKGDGSASETLERYPRHFTMLAFRSKSGGGELHQHFADFFTILDGHAALVTGGEVVEPKATAPGEVRGESVKGGSRQELRAGDEVHIPAGTPHQMLVASGDSITYFVVKVQESE